MVSGKSCIVLSISHSSSFDRALLSERRSNGPDGQAVGKGPTAGNTPSPDRVDGHFAGTRAHRGPRKLAIGWRMHVSEAADRVIRRWMHAWERLPVSRWGAAGSMPGACA